MQIGFGFWTYYMYHESAIRMGCLICLLFIKKEHLKYGDYNCHTGGIRWNVLINVQNHQFYNWNEELA